MALSYNDFSSSEQTKQMEGSTQDQKVPFSVVQATAVLPCKHNILQMTEFLGSYIYTIKMYVKNLRKNLRKNVRVEIT